MRKALILIAGLVPIVAIGFLSFRDYGISADEPILWHLGQDAVAYMKGEAPWPAETDRRYHGAIVEVPLAVLSNLIYPQNIENAGKLFLIRHLFTYVLFCGGIVGFYFLSKRWTRDWRLGLLGAAMLLLTPRIFAHAFFNSRDVPNLVFYVLAMLTLSRLVERPTKANAIVHGIVCALAMSLRMTGIFLPIITIVGLALTTDWQQPRRRVAFLALFALFALFFVFTTYVLWPLLWEHPIGNFLDAYRFMKSFGGGGFYMGGQLTIVPWHYVPVWMAITTPPLYSGLFLAGVAAIAARSARAPRSFLAREPLMIVVLLWLLLPVAPVMLGFAGIYDEWRHLFFVYPAFLLVALEGFRTLRHINARWFRRAAVGVTVLLLARTGWWMATRHPFENLYFAVPSGVATNFELDYWGMTFRPMLEAIAAQDRRSEIRLFSRSNIPRINLVLLPPEDAERMRFVERIDDADYILDNFRGDAYRKIYRDRYPLFHSVTVDGIEAGAVYVVEQRGLKPLASTMRM